LAISLASLDLQKKRRPCFKRGAALRKIVVPVVHALNTVKLVVEAALRDLAANPQGGQMRTHGSPQVANRKCVQPVIDAGKGGVQGVDADVQCTLPAVAAPLWKYEFTVTGYFGEGFQPANDRRHQGDGDRRSRLGSARR
jgi:hypothetical protein